MLRPHMEDGKIVLDDDEMEEGVEGDPLSPGEEDVDARKHENVEILVENEIRGILKRAAEYVTDVDLFLRRDGTIVSLPKEGVSNAAPHEEQSLEMYSQQIKDLLKQHDMSVPANFLAPTFGGN